MYSFYRIRYIRVFICALDFRVTPDVEDVPAHSQKETWLDLRELVMKFT